RSLHLPGGAADRYCCAGFFAARTVPRGGPTTTQCIVWGVPPQPAAPCVPHGAPDADTLSPRTAGGTSPGARRGSWHLRGRAHCHCPSRRATRALLGGRCIARVATGWYSHWRTHPW